MESTREFQGISKRFSLSYYLIKKQLYWLSYLPLPIPWYNKPVSIFFYLISFTFLSRLIIFIFVPLEPLLALYLGDFAYNLDSLHDIICSMVSFWLAAILTSFHLLDETNKSVKLQAWLTPLSTLEKGKDHFFKKPNKKLVFAAKLLFTNLKTSLVCCPSFVFCLYIPHMITNYANGQLVIVLLVHGVTIAMAGFMGICYIVSLSYFFAFYAFLIGQKLSYIAEIFKTQIERTTKSYRKIVSNSDQLISLVKQVYCADLFWSKVNSIVFFATFFPQILIVYSVFFVPLNAVHFISLIGLGSINFTCGLSVNFFCGVHARSKLNDCQKQLIRTIFIKDAKLRVPFKIKLLIISEYLFPRKLFAIFGALEMNSLNYLLVFIEMAIHLLLVILNANRK
uniref:Odorant receptor n=1 Tax=Tetranychus urticae TaxID=32264 RepID=T1KAD1_TETUR